MTLYGWDLSHFDWDRGPVDLAAARADGMVFVTHKATEGRTFVDPYFRAGVARARSAGFDYIGAYHVLHTTDPAGQVDHLLDVTNLAAPWWREHPGWFWQCDAERWADDFPPPTAVKAFCDLLAARTGRLVACYASRGQYGDRLAGLGHPLWNAAYGANEPGPYRRLYPGDTSRRWDDFSGQVPVFLQFGSRATIGQQLRCDVNAYRGSRDRLHALITGGTDMGIEIEALRDELRRFAAYLLLGKTNELMDPKHEGDAWVGDPATPTLPVIARGLAQLRAVRAEPIPVDVDAFAAALEPFLEQAAEKAVRKVLGAVDGATPPQV